MQSAITWMDPKGIILNEISQAGENNCHMISYMCESKPNKQNKNYTYREKIGDYQMGRGWGWPRRKGERSQLG